MRKIDVLVCAGFIGGVITFSQGISFARWSAWRGVGSFIDLHATLLTLAGISLCCAMLAIRSLKVRIERLEQILADRDR